VRFLENDKTNLHQIFSQGLKENTCSYNLHTSTFPN